MEEYQFIYKDKLSKNDSRKMIASFAKHGNHDYNFKFSNDDDIRGFFSKNNISYDEVVERCKLPENNVLKFENLIGSTFQTHGVSVEKVDFISGKSKPIIQGDGTFSEAAYWTQMEKAKESFDRSVMQKSYHDFLNSIVLAISSIEAYVNYRAQLWNDNSANAVKFVDNKSNKTSLEEKLSNWIPKMSNSSGLDKSHASWCVYKEFTKLRDDMAIHIKDPNPSITYKEFVKKLNKFKYLANMLYRLHLLFNEKVPRVIIRGMYIRVIELKLVSVNR